MARLSALQELVELVPPPVAPQGAPFDWPAAESALGTALPSDYKAFCDAYGHGTFFNGWLWAPHTPHAPSGDGDLLSSYWLDILADVETEYRPYPEPGGVLPFLTSELNYLFAWRTVGPSDSWPVLVQTDGSDWHHFERTATGMLLSALRDQLFDPPQRESDLEVTFASACTRPAAPAEPFVLRGHGYISSEGHYVTLDLAGALGGSRRAQLDELLAALEPADRARIVRATAKRSGEVLHVRGKRDIDPLQRAVQDWANRRAGWPPR